MSEEVKIMKSDVVALHGIGCPDVREVLEALFPVVFKKEWRNITGVVEWRVEHNGNGRYFLNGWYEGDDIFYVSQKQRQEGSVISHHGNKKYDIRIEYNGDTHSIFIRDK